MRRISAAMARAILCRPSRMIWSAGIILPTKLINPGPPTPATTRFPMQLFCRGDRPTIYLIQFLRDSRRDRATMLRCRIVRRIHGRFITSANCTRRSKQSEVRSKPRYHQHRETDQPPVLRDRRYQRRFGRVKVNCNSHKKERVLWRLMNQTFRGPKTFRDQIIDTRCIQTCGDFRYLQIRALRLQ